MGRCSSSTLKTWALKGRQAAAKKQYTMCIQVERSKDVLQWKSMRVTDNAAPFVKTSFCRLKRAPMAGQEPLKDIHHHNIKLYLAQGAMLVDKEPKEWTCSFGCSRLLELHVAGIFRVSSRTD